jgi:hypothetical protein
VVLREGGRHAEARPLIERAVTIYEQARGGDFVGLVAPLIELATLELETRGCHAADPILTRALRIAADDPTASYALIPLAGCEVEAGRPERALELARRAASIREAANMPARLLAEARFAEACALFATGHKGDARKLVDLARRDASPKLTVQIDEWVKLSERQRRRL